MSNVHRYRNEIIAITDTWHRIADEILHKLKETYPLIGVGSVYRNLNELVEDWILMKHVWLWKKNVYEKLKPHHWHLYCTASWIIQDIDITWLEVDKLDIPKNFNTNELQIVINWRFSNKKWELCHIWWNLSL
jgi:Fe2+ or Zn2+ uptake regulation protein